MILAFYPYKTHRKIRRFLLYHYPKSVAGALVPTYADMPNRKRERH